MKNQSYVQVVVSFSIFLLKISGNLTSTIATKVPDDKYENSFNWTLVLQMLHKINEFDYLMSTINKKAILYVAKFIYHASNLRIISFV